MKTQAIERTETTVNKTLTLKLAAIAALSFFLPQTQILGGISPFAVALSACLPTHFAVLTAFGSLIGYFVRGFSQDTLLYLIVLAVVMAVKILLRKKKITKKLSFTAGLTLAAFLAVFLAGGAILRFSGSAMVLRACEALIACGITCFFSLSTGAFLRLTTLSQFSQTELASTTIVLMLSVVSLCPVSIYQFNMGVIFGVILLYIVTNRLGTIGGAVGGILVAISLNLYSLTFLPFSGVLIVACFLSGIFHALGKIGQVAVFLSSSVFCAFIVGISLEMLFQLMCVVIASGLFLSLPERVLAWIYLPSLNRQNPDVDESMQANIKNRLGFAAETIRDLQDSLTQVSTKLGQMEQQDITQVYNKTATSVCQACGLKLTCWDEHYNDTVDAFSKLTALVREHQVITGEDVRSLPQINCCRTNQLAQALQNNYHEHTTKGLTSRHISDIRGLAVEQLTGISQMLTEVSEEIADIKSNDAAASAIVTDIFTGLADKPLCVFSYLNQYDRLEIEIDTTAGVDVDTAELRDEISRALKREFAEPSVSRIQNKMRISLYEKPTYLLEFGVYQMSGREEDICGDSYEYFCDNKGNAYVILSDGMGSGRHAALDSTMTCGIILKLIKAGFGLDSIIKFVNSSLQVKSNNESLSTIDIAKFDLFTGEIDFYKAGCASSFLMLENTLAKVDTNSLPVGILQGIEFDRKSFLLHEGDTMVMVSDGVLEMGEKHIAAMIQSYGDHDCETLSKKLCIHAASRSEKHDDLTAIVIRLQPGI